tara:strand:+ start:205 stop:924 length:720 start_codon:yes stop_codon:yes gene_type:complete
MATTNPRMALFIPRIFAEHADPQFIATIFDVSGIGWVDHVDLIEKNRDGEHFFQGFVHFNYWYNTHEAFALQAQVLNPCSPAQLYLPVREVRPGVWRQAFWILAECQNPRTPLEIQLSNQLYDERAQSDWEINEMREILAQQDALLERLFQETDESIDEFDPLLNTPEDVSELPILGAELAAAHPECFMKDFYMESHEDAFSPEWHSLSDSEKRVRLDAELDAWAAETKRLQNASWVSV